jgi:hypothetical protein
VREKRQPIVSGTIARLILSDGSVALVDSRDISVVAGSTWSRSRRANGISYAVARRAGRLVYLHRLILAAEKGQIVDHKNRDGLDNRRSNIMVVTKGQNTQNRLLARRLLGVSRTRTGRWRARIKVDYEEIYLGCFAGPEAAAAAYDDAAQRYFGPDAKFNSLSER